MRTPIPRNRLVRGVYSSEAIYVPETLPKDMSIPVFAGKTW